MSFPYSRHTLSISDALARSGVKGGAIPPVAGEIVPVMVMADLSRSYSGEPLEIRALVAFQSFVVPNGERGFARIESVSPGGCVVEELVTIVSNAPTFSSWVDRVATQDAPAATEFELQKVEAGGDVSRCRAFIGSTLALPSGAGPFDFTGFSSQRVPVRRTYVPSGASLICFSDDVSTGFMQFQFAAGWREIPAPIGIP